MRADNTRHIAAAAQRRHEYTRAKAIQALRTLNAEGRPVTFEAVAQQASISRSWLYAQSDLRSEIEQLRAAYRRAPATQPASVLADLAGISISIAERWSQWAKRNWAAYVGQRAADNAEGVDSRKPAKQTLQTC